VYTSVLAAHESVYTPLLAAVLQTCVQDATVTDDTGVKLDSGRRAKAGGVSPQLNAAPGEDIPTDLYRRGYAFANDFTGYVSQ
jgi:hypothetical protein